MLAPEAVSATGVPGQIGAVGPEIEIIGEAFTVTSIEAFEVHPLADVVVTV